MSGVERSTQTEYWRWEGAWTRNQIWRSEWYLGSDGNILLCFVFSFTVLSISLLSLFPDSAFAAGGSLCEHCSAGRTGPLSLALPQGQWVYSGSGEQASLQFHYSSNWLKWKLYLTSHKSPCNYSNARGERRREVKRNGEMRTSFQVWGLRGRLGEKSAWIIHLWTNSQETIFQQTDICWNCGPLISHPFESQAHYEVEWTVNTQDKVAALGKDHHIIIIHYGTVFQPNLFNF